MGNDASELHLFLIWEYGRQKELDILADIRKSFPVLDVFEIAWADDLFSSNLTRFYGQNLPPNSHKELHCGKGPFKVIIVEDKTPDYQVRGTSHGPSRVNVNMFDKKQLYRSWTGGGHRIHATDNLFEVNQNLIFLLGMSVEDYQRKYPGEWDGEVNAISKDPPGARGWSSLRELFYVLNNAIDYVVLRNFEGFPDQYTMKSHGDIDFMTRNPVELKFLVNAEPVYPRTPRVLHHAMVNGERVLFDFRFLGDNYYDKKWQERILQSRVLTSEGFYRPTEEDYFYTLLYHALIHKPEVAADYRERLPVIARNIGLDLSGHNFAEPKSLCALLSEWLDKKGYSFTEPNDLSVYLNLNNAPLTSISIPRIFSLPLSVSEKVRAILMQTKDCSTNSPEFLNPLLQGTSAARYHFSGMRTLPVAVFDMPRDYAVLELGCATGVVTRYLGEHFREVVAVEKDAQSAEAIKMRCRDLPNVAVLNTNYRNPELEKKFDVAVIIADLSHAPNESMAKIELRQKIVTAASALSEKGVLIFAVNNSDSIKNRYTPNKQMGLSVPEIDQMLAYTGLAACEKYFVFQDVEYPRLFVTEKALNRRSHAVGLWISSVPWYDSTDKQIDSDVSSAEVCRETVQGSMKDHANAFVITASNGALPEVPWLLKAYQQGLRRKEAWTETTLVEKEGELRVIKEGKVIQNDPYRFNPNSEVPFVDGETLEMQLFGAVEQADRNRFLALVDDYCRYLVSQHGIETEMPPLTGSSDRFLRGESFDVIARNVIVKDGSWHDFDNEWQSVQPVPLSYLCFRSILYIIVKIGLQRFCTNMNISSKNRPLLENDVVVVILRQLPWFTEMTQGSATCTCNTNRRFMTLSAAETCGPRLSA